MPHGPQHKNQQRKNIVLSLLLLGLIALLYAITLMRMGFHFS